jgi:hypothetical protein
MKLVPGIAIAVAMVAAVLEAAGSQAAPSRCNPAGRLVGDAVIFCGPATARLSVFAGAKFENGTCRITRVNGVPQFTLKLGARTADGEANSRKPYFGLIVTGPLSHPTGGGVIAYWRGHRWGGAGVSFNGDAHAGSFVAVGIRKSPGRATGRYQC